jgi:hypothetical protein
VDPNGDLPKWLINAAQRITRDALAKALVAMTLKRDPPHMPEYANWDGEPGRTGSGTGTGKQSPAKKTVQPPLCLSAGGRRAWLYFLRRGATRLVGGSRRHRTLRNRRHAHKRP